MIILSKTQDVPTLKEERWQFLELTLKCGEEQLFTCMAFGNHTDKHKFPLNHTDAQRKWPLFSEPPTGPT